jgi:hypothetical protein
VAWLLNSVVKGIFDQKFRVEDDEKAASNRGLFFFDHPGLSLFAHLTTVFQYLYATSTLPATVDPPAISVLVSELYVGHLV